MTLNSFHLFSTIKRYFTDKHIFPKHSFHCLMHIFIPQTVDDGIQHGNHDGVKYRHNHVMVQRIAGTWSHIHEEDGSMKN